MAFAGYNTLLQDTQSSECTQHKLLYERSINISFENFDAFVVSYCH